MRKVENNSGRLTNASPLISINLGVLAPADFTGLDLHFPAKHGCTLGAGPGSWRTQIDGILAASSEKPR
jgi:hypothetical protein